ncbi:MAG TPA: RuvA C-terminal domain-containing protein, partial [Armatimonadota bacterium]|nr:RuvA C-terminal domain-containing protein [Armatimonadota bacterium]
FSSSSTRKPFFANPYPADEDVMNALINLGYSAAEAARAAQAVPSSAKTTEERIRVALQNLGAPR